MATSIEEMGKNMDAGAVRIAHELLSCRIGELPVKTARDFTEGTVPGSDHALLNRMRAKIIEEIRQIVPHGQPDLSISCRRAPSVTVTVTLHHV